MCRLALCVLRGGKKERKKRLRYGEALRGPGDSGSKEEVAHPWVSLCLALKWDVLLFLLIN